MRKGFKALKSRAGVFITAGLILLLVYSISFLIPVFWSLMTSMKKEIEFMLDKFALPKSFYFENYIYSFDNMAVPVKGLGNIYIVEMFYNSICYALVSTTSDLVNSCIRSLSLR